MYGLIPLYGVDAQDDTTAASIAAYMAREDLPDDVSGAVVGTTVMGGGEVEGIYSVEVEVLFPDVDDESALPDRETLFPRADGVSYLAIDAV